MKRKLLFIGLAVFITCFTGLAIYGAIHNQEVIHSKNIEIESKTFKLQKLETEFKQLNTDYQKEKESDTLDQQKEQEYQKKIKDLEDQYKALELSKANTKAEQERIAQAQTKLANAIVPTASAYSGGREDWLIAVGIPESEWWAVDCVIAGCQGISGEAGWNGVTRWNTAGSGAYGICQSLPASKMASAGADYMTNGLTQLKWCNIYAQGYGGWVAAWNFRKCTGYCYSPRTNSTVYKDHTWW